MTFSVVYACFVTIKYWHPITPSWTPSTWVTMISNKWWNCSTTISRPSIRRPIVSHSRQIPMFTDMRNKIAAKFGKDFLQVGKGLINQQVKVAFVHLLNGNKDLRWSYFNEFATFIMLSKDNDYEFNDIKFKPSKLWTLCDDSCYGSINGLLSTLHKNPIGARRGECNHKANKCVHSHSCARLGQAKIKTRTAILFNAKQLDCRIAVTWNTKFCKWL